MDMLALFRDLTTTFEAKENAGGNSDYDEYEAARNVAKTISFVRPVTAMEALAQIVFLYDEATDIDQANEWTEARCKEWSDRMTRRAFALAYWIERTHAIDRREYALANYCSDTLASSVLPHAPAESWHRGGANTKTLT